MIAMIDDAVGDVLATLERTGLAENTVVIFISDHGDFMGDHQLMLKGPLHYRGVTRTPFIWYDPANPAQRCAQCRAGGHGRHRLDGARHAPASSRSTASKATRCCR